MSRVQPGLPKYDFYETLLWQFEQCKDDGDSSNLVKIIDSHARFYDECVHGTLRVLYNDFLNIDTANLWGLKVWSKILGISQSRYTVSDASGVFFGFDGSGEQFDSEPFMPTSSSLNVTLDEFRMMVWVKYFSLFWDGSVVSLNDFLRYAFRRYGSVRALDNFNMSNMIYVVALDDDHANTFNFLFNPEESIDLWPRQAGVGLLFSDISGRRFSFDGVAETFDEAPFQRVFISNTRGI
jgi:hypothetical protein